MEYKVNSKRLRWAVSIAAIVGTAPYVVLKALWISGSRVGLVDPDFGNGLTMALLNASTLGMDVIAAVLALSFVMRWGRSVPAPVMLLPMWVATGLLGQILLTLPLQLLAGPEAAHGDVGQTALASWVPNLVYGGFAWQGFFLIVGFALYAVERWSAVLGIESSRVGSLAAGHAGSDYAGAGPGLTRACVGGTVVVAVVEGVNVGFGELALINAAVSTVLAIATGLAVMALSSGRMLALPRFVWIGLGWLGSGALCAWGSYLVVIALIPNGIRPEGGIDLSSLVQSAVRAVVGALCAVCLLRAVRVQHVNRYLRS